MRSRSRILRDSYSKNLISAGKLLGQARKLPQERVEGLALFLVQRLQKRLRSLARFTLEDPHHVLALLRQIDRPTATILGVHAALGDAAALEVVEQRDHRAGVDAGKRSKLLLRDPRSLGHDRH